MQKLTRVLTVLFLGLVGVVAVLAIIGLLLPESVHVERSITIDAPQATVFALLNGYVSYRSWSPWYDLDPEASYTIEGPPFGVGAAMSWSSDKPHVGSGTNRIVESEPFQLVKTALDFGDRSRAESTFVIERVAGGTRVSWGLDTGFGFNLVGRYYGLFVDGMVGADLEDGLISLRTLAERLPKADWSDIEISVQVIEPATIAYTSGTSTRQSAQIRAALAAAHGRVSAFLDRRGLTINGAPLAITTSSSEDSWSFDAGVPIAGTLSLELPPSAPIRIGRTYGGRAVVAIHEGPYDRLGATHAKADAFIAAHGLETTDRRWEEYVSDAGSTPSQRPITRICVPVK